MTDLTITPGSIVLLAGFDDIPAHQFLVEEVHRGLHHRHSPHRSPCGGIRRTRHRVGSAGPVHPQLTTEQASGKGLVPAPALALLTKTHPITQTRAIAPERRRHVTSDQVRPQDPQHLGLPQDLPQGTASALLGTALKQSLKTSDATQAKVRVAELNQTFTTIIKEAQAHALATPHTAPALPAQAPRLAVGRPRYQRARLGPVAV